MLFSVLVREVERHMVKFMPQDLASTVWAFASAGRPDMSLFATLPKAAEGCMFEFNAQGLASSS